MPRTIILIALSGIFGFFSGVLGAHECPLASIGPIDGSFSSSRIVPHGEDAVEIWTAPASVVRSKSWIQVSYKGLPSPRGDDWIGLIVPADASFNDTAPAKFKWLAANPAWSTGSGSLWFQIASHRQDVVFALFRGGLTNPRRVATSAVLRAVHPNAPEHIHLTLTDNPHEMLVQWTTRDDAHSRVLYGLAPDALSSSAPPEPGTSYDRSDMCGPPASTVGFIPPGHLHHAVLTHLEPDTRVYYAIEVQDGSDMTAMWRSDVHAFKTLPILGAPLSALVVADLGTWPEDGSNELQPNMRGSTGTIARLAGEAAATSTPLLLHLGDLSYARGYVSQWDEFLAGMEPLVAATAYMVAIGNHERDWPRSGDRFDATPGAAVTDSGGECGVPAERRLAMPTTAPDEPWYSFNAGPVHFLIYSTEHATQRGSQQRHFMQRDLEAVNRARTPWVVLGGHRPLYVSSSNEWQPDGDQPVAQALRADLEELLVGTGVDLTLHGHHHSYQRTCPVRDGACVGHDEDGVARGPVHVVLGHAGADLCWNVAVPRPSIYEAIHVGYGYVRLEANTTHLVLESVSDADGSLIDRVALRKPEGWGAAYHARRGGPTPRGEKRRPWWRA